MRGSRGGLPAQEPPTLVGIRRGRWGALGGLRVCRPYRWGDQDGQGAGPGDRWTALCSPPATESSSSPGDRLASRRRFGRLGSGLGLFARVLGSGVWHHAALGHECLLRLRRDWLRRDGLARIVALAEQGLFLGSPLSIALVGHGRRCSQASLSSFSPGHPGRQGEDGAASRPHLLVSI